MTSNREQDGDAVGISVPLKWTSSALAAVADGKMVAYRMPAIRDGQTVATGMLFVPKGTPPAGGWSLIVFGHGIGIIFLSKSCNAQGYSKIKNTLLSPTVITSPRKIAEMV